MSEQGYENFQHSDQPGHPPTGGNDAGDVITEPAPARAGMEIPKPGPHPHEAADFRTNGQGDAASWPDPMEGRRD